jgi:hypothetical protein
MKKIPYGRQNITEEDIQAVIDVLKSDWLTQGPKIQEFEEAFSNYIGCKYAVAVSNGTAALHLCTMALDVKPGDKVITTPITFAATANCVRYCGGEVVFADIDPDTYLLDINKVEELLSSSPKGTYKGIIPVDFAGRAVNLEAFRELANKYDCWLIEDACHAPGGYFVDSNGINQKCGNGVYADLAIFSFHPVKHIAAGEGGMITTNNKILYEKLLMLRTHGIIKSESHFQNSIEFAYGLRSENRNLNLEHAGTKLETYPSWYHEMQELGYNYRLTDFQAALAISQLRRANEGLVRRVEIAKMYETAIANIPNLVKQQGFVVGHAYHLYVVEVTNRNLLINELRNNDIFAQVHYIPTHLMPYYRQFGWKEGDLPFAEEYYSRCLSLPMYPTLTDEQFEYVVNSIKKCC